MSDLSISDIKAIAKSGKLEIDEIPDCVVDALQSYYGSKSSGFFNSNMVPYHVMSILAAAHAVGRIKYGKFNWRLSGIDLHTYTGAMFRHAVKIILDQNHDRDGGTIHGGHIAACASIIIDSIVNGSVFIDGVKVDDAKYEIEDVSTEDLAGVDIIGVLLDVRRSLRDSRNIGDIVKYSRRILFLAAEIIDRQCRNIVRDNDFESLEKFCIDETRRVYATNKKVELK